MQQHIYITNNGTKDKAYSNDKHATPDDNRNRHKARKSFVASNPKSQ